jgi:hypothetical protein
LWRAALEVFGDPMTPNGGDPAVRRAVPIGRPRFRILYDAGDPR